MTQESTGESREPGRVGPWVEDDQFRPPDRPAPTPPPAVGIEPQPAPASPVAGAAPDDTRLTSVDAPRLMGPARTVYTPPPDLTPELPSSEAPPEGERAPAGLLDMARGEEILQEVDSGEDGRFILTNLRLIYNGGDGGNSIFSTADLNDVTAVELARRPRDNRSAWWGLAGAIAAIGVWQVTTNEMVGLIAGAIVGAFSAYLLADFWFRPAGVVLSFKTAGGGVEGPVSGKRLRDAEQLTALVQRLRAEMRGGSRGDRTSRPPGGSPGL